MKKLISLTLVVVMMMSAFTFCAFAADTKTETRFDKIEENKEITITFRTGKSNTFGDSYTPINTVYMKDENIAYDFDNSYFKLRAITNEGKILCFLPSFPYIHMTVIDLPFVEIDIWGVIQKLSNFTMDFLVYQGSYITTIDDVTYYVEEFNDRGSVVNSFFYVGDELKVLKAEDFSKKTIQYTYFDKVSLVTDTSVFHKPVISFEFTKVLMFIITLLNGIKGLPII